MTGPEHYRTAEDLLSTADEYDRDGAPATANARRAEAQVHAMLAMAAATALNDNDPTGDGMPRLDYREWLRTAGITQPKGDDE
jgi:hypothetical protein